MLRKVREGEKIDKAELASYLKIRGLMKDASSQIEIQQYANGYSNLTYLLTIEGNDYVLRRPPTGAIKRGHDMGREYKVLSNLSKHFSKAPKTFLYEDTGTVIGSKFYLMEKVEGVVINYKEAKERNLSPADFNIISESWLDAFVEFHALDYRKMGLADLGRPEGYVERQVTNWGKQYLKAATLDIAAAKVVMEWMQDNQPRHYEHVMIHNDFKYDNILFQEGNWNTVNAILDWEMCTLGDPLMDLGTALGYWVMADDGPLFTQTIPTATVFPGNPTRSEVVQAYALKSGRNIDNLIFYYVFGLFKIAVIAQQIYYRYEKGMTQNPKFAKLDQVCKFLCETAHQAILKNRIENLY